MVEPKTNANPTTDTGAGADASPCAPVTYTFDNRAFIVQPIFKDNAANTLRDVLLRLMRAEFEPS